MIPLTAGETRRLFSLHTRVTRPASHHEHWSHWRRRHQARAQRFHYERRIKGLTMGGSGTGAVPRWRPVSSPRPSNRACGSPAHGLPTFFTGGVRPSRASPGKAWAG